VEGQDAVIIQGTVPAAGKLIVTDSTTPRLNMYDGNSPAELAPDQPAPGFEDVNKPKNRLPNTDKKYEPR